VIRVSQTLAIVALLSACQALAWASGATPGGTAASSELGLQQADHDRSSAAEYLKTLPDVSPPVVDSAEISSLAALPLSCIDHPQNYLWVHDEKAHPVEDYAMHRESMVAMTGIRQSTLRGYWSHCLSRIQKCFWRRSSVSGSPSTRERQYRG
jgi:hypothetical protein